jgi:hypothetical protein
VNTRSIENLRLNICPVRPGGRVKCCGSVSCEGAGGAGGTPRSVGLHRWTLGGKGGGVARRWTVSHLGLVQRTKPKDEGKALVHTSRRWALHLSIIAISQSGEVYILELKTSYQREPVTERDVSDVVGLAGCCRVRTPSPSSARTQESEERSAYSREISIKMLCTPCVMDIFILELVRGSDEERGG